MEAPFERSRGEGVDRRTLKPLYQIWVKVFHGHVLHTRILGSRSNRDDGAFSGGWKDRHSNGGVYEERFLPRGFDVVKKNRDRFTKKRQLGAGEKKGGFGDRLAFDSVKEIPSRAGILYEGSKRD